MLRLAKDRSNLLKALKEIQELCAKSVLQTTAIQDIWRTANFAVHDAEKKPRRKK